MPKPHLDCKGLACPHPVLRAKDLLEREQPDELEMIVDNDAAKENVTRFLSGQGYSVTAQAQGTDWLLAAARSGAKPAAPEDLGTRVTRAPEGGLRITVFITADTIGRGDDVLGAKLMVNFLSTLPELGRELWRIILVNAGVKLAVDGSPVLDSLLALEKMGADILVCGTCLDHFGLLDKRRVGATTNMLDVVTSLQLADKVIQV